MQYKGRDLIAMSEDELQSIRGNEIAMIFQDPMTSMNPVYRVGAQIAEALKAHNATMNKSACRARAVELLRAVGIPNPEARVDDYPHQFSGGMRQRAMIAMALANNPDVLIADEPTTALDVTIQAQIIELIDRLKDEFNSAVILITHDLGVVAEIADEIIVMYAGRVVEAGTKRRSSTTRSTRTRGACSARSPGSTGRRRSSCTDRGHSALADQPTAGVHVPPRCPPRVREVLGGAAPREPRRGRRGIWTAAGCRSKTKRTVREATIAGETRAA